MFAGTMFLAGWIAFATAATGSEMSSTGAHAASDLVQGETRRLLTRLVHSRYTTQMRFDEENGRFDCNCSGFANYVVRRVLALDTSGELLAGPTRPRAADFYDALARPKGLKASARVPGDWLRVGSLFDAIPGDVVAWRNTSSTGPTGHVMIIDAAPVRESSGLVRVVVIDSADSPHFDDTRAPGQTGIGRGTLWFVVDAQGAPVAYVRRSREEQAVAEPIAIGRLLRPKNPRAP
jgi:hypothetical protein